jgi:hypothetical protein
MGSNITKVGITNDKITARGGLPLILRYIERTGLYSLISNTVLSKIIIHSKGLKLQQFLKQMFAFLIDGTNMSISGFDSRKTDEGYAALLENKTNEMASSHQIKRFFTKLSIIPNSVYCKILHELFIWRLHIEKPMIIELGIDTMVMDNDTSNKREGNEPTYKKVKGFQPLHISCGSFLIDVLFRSGSAHSNHGTDYTDRIRIIVELIRKRYSKDVPIILFADSGFADQKAYATFEQDIKIHYVTTSKIYSDVKEYAHELPSDVFGKYSKNKAIWLFVEFGNKLKSWNKFRRCILTKLHRDEDGQYIMSFEKPDTLIYTNIGMNKEIDDKLRIVIGGEQYFKTEYIIQKSHERGADELIHRSIKELATKEQLPFKSLGMNRSYYFLLVISHFIFETYKRDITPDIISITVYPNTFRRKLIDFAVKLTSHARNITLCVTKTIFETINITDLWQRCQVPPKIQFV